MNRSMHAFSQVFGDFLDLATQAFPDRYPFQGETAVALGRADMRKTEKVECFRFVLASILAVGGGISSKLDQSRLFRVKRQAKRREAGAEFCKISLGCRFMLEADHEIICIPHDGHFACGFGLPLVFNP